MNDLNKRAPAAIAAVAGSVALMLCLPAVAHHSTAMFDFAKTVEVKGTIKEFQWTNPHIWIQISVPNAKGGVEDWSVEGDSPNLVSRQGWQRNSFKTGDKVVIKVHPMRSGEPGGSFMTATFPDGRTLGTPGPQY